MITAPSSEIIRKWLPKDIAFVVDSACDVPKQILSEFPVYIIPLGINFSDASYLDRVNISGEELVEKLEHEIPKTSTPSPQHVREAFEQARDDGFSHIIACTISSGLSSTFSLIENIASDIERTTIEVIDSLNIGSGAGMIIYHAANLLREGLSFENIVASARNIVPRTRIFFIPDTLDYLYRGGRISATVHSIGSFLNVKPVFTCDKEGKYAVIAKPRGRAKAFTKALNIVSDIVADAKQFRFLSADGFAEADKEKLLSQAREKFPQASEIIDGGHLSPALVVHTGPGLLGCVVQVVK